MQSPAQRVPPQQTVLARQPDGQASTDSQTFWALQLTVIPLPLPLQLPSTAQGQPG